MSASFGDFNLDGYLDLYVANYLDYQLETAHPCFLEGVHIYCGPHEYPGARDTLYRNNGDGTFTDVTTRAEVHNVGKGLGVLFTDYNNDGYPDIFVANDAVPISFTRTTQMALSQMSLSLRALPIIQKGVPQQVWASPREITITTVFRISFVTNFSLEINSLFHNDGDGFYTMTTFETDSRIQASQNSVSAPNSLTRITTAHSNFSSRMGTCGTTYQRLRTHSPTSNSAKFLGAQKKDNSRIYLRQQVSFSNVLLSHAGSPLAITTTMVPRISSSLLQ